MGAAMVGLPDGLRRVLAVVAHPEDASAGLGAVIDHLVSDGTTVAVLCFTRGAPEPAGHPPELAAERAAAFAAATAALGAGSTALLDYEEGRLSAAPVSTLAARVRAMAARTQADHLLAFAPDGVTGDPDHVQATRAALTAGRQLALPVLGCGGTEYLRALSQHTGCVWEYAGQEPGG
jgi:LmbE family N-acetylglucosaminyl deacetylase